MKFKFLPKTLAQYKWNSIFVRYLSILLVVFLVMLTITSTVVLRNVNTTHTINSNRLFDKIIVQAQNTVDKIENSVLTATSALVYDQRFILVVGSSPDNAYYNDAFNSVSDMLTYMNIGNDYIDSVYLYSTYNDYVYTMNSSPITSNSTKHFSDMVVFKTYVETNKSPFFRKPIIGKKCYTYLSFVSMITPSDGKPAYVVHNIDVPQIFSMFNCPAHLLDENGEIIYSSSSTVFNSKKALDKAKSTEVHTIKFGGDSFSVALENPEIKIGISPWIYVLLILFVILVSFALAFFIATALYKYIDKICQLVQTPFAASENKTADSMELSYITTKLKDLVLEHCGPNDELTKKLMQLNDVQATALQLQISPHFLFNTLNLISSLSLAEARKDTKITIVVDLLSKMLSTILDTSNLVCSLDNELTYTKQYIEIQKYKYEDFDIEWNISEKDMNIPIVKFTLQPIIENAIHHGIAGMDDGIITISGKEKLQEKTYELIITDNGSGITKDQEIRINSIISNDNNPGTSIGLWNTNRRLKILLGDEYGLQIKSKEKGTAVVITLPLNK